jgi:hypothetical protein
MQCALQLRNYNPFTNINVQDDTIRVTRRSTQTASERLQLARVCLRVVCQRRPLQKRRATHVADERFLIRMRLLVSGQLSRFEKRRSASALAADVWLHDRVCPLVRCQAKKMPCRTSNRCTASRPCASAYAQSNSF